MKPKKYYLDMFHMNVLYMYGWSKKAYTKYMKQHYRMDPDIHSANGFTMHLSVAGEQDVIVIWTDRRDVTILAHECVHGANMVLDAVGVHPSFKNDETQAYLVQLILEKGLT
jgi:hypothetical protein